MKTSDLKVGGLYVYNGGDTKMYMEYIEPYMDEELGQCYRFKCFNKQGRRIKRGINILRNSIAQWVNPISKAELSYYMVVVMGARIQHPNGFTLNLLNPSFDIDKQSGYVVSIPIGDRSPATLCKVVSTALVNGGLVGGWMDSKYGLWYYDACEIVQDYDTAISLAKERGETATYDIGHKCEIYIADVLVR